MLNREIQIATRIDERMLEAIETWRGKVRPTVPPRSEAIRMMIEVALATEPPKIKAA
jgi:hypothetical protein